MDVDVFRHIWSLGVHMVYLLCRVLRQLNHVLKLRMAGDGFYTGLVNGTKDNNIMGWDDSVSTPMEQVSPNVETVSTKKVTKND